MPPYPCDRSPTSLCEPLTTGDVLIRDIGRRSERAASQRARGFSGRSKKR